MEYDLTCADQQQDRQAVISGIQKVILDIVKRIAADQPPLLETTSRSGTTMSLVEEEVDGSFSLNQGAHSRVSKTLRGTTAILLIMKFVLRLLRTNKTATRKRLDLFKFSNEFGNQIDVQM